MSETENVEQRASGAVSKHTPGPWTVDRTHDDVVMVDTVSGSAICDVYGDYNGEREANAALIAAAPVQHDALRLAEQYLAKRVGHLPTSEGYKVLTTIRDAIAAGVTP